MDWPWPSVVVPRLTLVVCPFGRLTTTLTPCAGLGPLLVRMTVTVTVWPGTPLAGGVIWIATSATGVTVRTAVAPLALVPTLVVKEPALMVLVAEPPSELVTTTVAVQVEPGEIAVPLRNVKEPAAGAALTGTLQPVVVVKEGDALVKPVG